MSIITFTGKSENQYHFELYAPNQYFKDNAGVYIFLRKELNNYRIIYIGQTESFVDRLYKYFKNHTQYECILRNKFTHVALLPIHTGEEYRLKVETDLRHYYSTLCNEQ